MIFSVFQLQLGKTIRFGLSACPMLGYRLRGGGLENPVESGAIVGLARTSNPEMHTGAFSEHFSNVFKKKGD